MRVQFRFDESSVGQRLAQPLITYSSLVERKEMIYDAFSRCDLCAFP